MGIKFHCPNGHRLNVKSFLAGKRGVCPHCSTPVDIPLQSDPAAEKRTSKKNAIGSGSSGSGVAQPAAPMASNDSPHPASVNSASVNSASPNSASANSASPHPTSTNPSPVAPRAVAAPQTVQAAQGVAPMSVPQGGVATATVSPAAVVPSIPAVGPASTAAAQPDPIAEAPDAVWYVRPPAGGQYGPARGDVMRQWIQEERVTPDSLVWREGWSDWQTASTAFPELATPTPASGPGIASPAAPGLAGPAAAVSSSSATDRSLARRPRRRSKQLAVATVVTLGVVCVALIVALVFVVRGTL